MEDEPIIDAKEIEEQLYYPPLNNENNPEEINSFQEDEYFADKSNSNAKKDYLCEIDKITRIDRNTFIIYENKLCKIFWFFILILGIISIIIFLIVIIIVFDFLPLLLFTTVSIIVCVGACFICKCDDKISLMLEPNSITFTKAGIFKQNKKVYKIEELEKVAIFDKRGKDEEAQYFQIFNFYFVKKSGEKERFHSVTIWGFFKKVDVDPKGFKSFIDLLNAHINKNKVIQLST